MSNPKESPKFVIIDHLETEVDAEGKENFKMVGTASDVEAAHIFADMVDAEAHQLPATPGEAQNDPSTTQRAESGSSQPKSFASNWDSGHKSVFEEWREARQKAKLQ